MFANVTKLSYHLTHEDSRGANAEVPSGVRRAPARAPLRPVQARRSAAERGGARAACSGPRGSPWVGRCVTCSSRGLVERRAGSGGFVRAPAAARRDSLLRPAHPRSRRDGYRRADLSGDDGLSARPRARARVGEHTERRPRGRSRASALCGSYVARRVVRRLLRAPRAHARQGRRRPRDRAGARRRIDAGRPARPEGGSRIRDAGATTCVGIDNRRAGYVVAEHVLRLGSGASGLCGASARRRPPWTRARRDTGGVLHARAPDPVDRADPPDSTRPRSPLSGGGWGSRVVADAIVCANDRDGGRLHADSSSARCTRFRRTSGSSGSTTGSTRRCCPCR